MGLRGGPGGPKPQLLGKNKVLLEQSHTHFFPYIWLLLSSSFRTE